MILDGSYRVSTVVLTTACLNLRSKAIYDHPDRFFGLKDCDNA